MDLMDLMDYVPRRRLEPEQLLDIGLATFVEMLGIQVISNDKKAVESADDEAHNCPGHQMPNYLNDKMPVYTVGDLVQPEKPVVIHYTPLNSTSVTGRWGKDPLPVAPILGVKGGLRSVKCLACDRKGPRPALYQMHMLECGHWLCRGCLVSIAGNGFRILQSTNFQEGGLRDLAIVLFDKLAHIYCHDHVAMSQAFINFFDHIGWVCCKKVIDFGRFVHLEDKYCIGNKLFDQIHDTYHDSLKQAEAFGRRILQGEDFATAFNERLMKLKVQTAARVSMSSAPGTALQFTAKPPRGFRERPMKTLPPAPSASQPTNTYGSSQHLTSSQHTLLSPAEITRSLYRPVPRKTIPSNASAFTASNLNGIDATVGDNWAVLRNLGAINATFSGKQVETIWSHGSIQDTGVESNGCFGPVGGPVGYAGTVHTKAWTYPVKTSIKVVHDDDVVAHNEFLGIVQDLKVAPKVRVCCINDNYDYPMAAKVQYSCSVAVPDAHYTHSIPKIFTYPLMEASPKPKKGTYFDEHVKLVGELTRTLGNSQAVGDSQVVDDFSTRSVSDGNSNMEGLGKDPKWPGTVEQEQEHADTDHNAISDTYDVEKTEEMKGAANDTPTTTRACFDTLMEAIAPYRFQRRESNESMRSDGIWSHNSNEREMSPNTEASSCSDPVVSPTVSIFSGVSCAQPGGSGASLTCNYNPFKEAVEEANEVLEEVSDSESVVDAEGEENDSDWETVDGEDDSDY